MNNSSRFSALLQKTLEMNAFFSGISGLTGLILAGRLAAFLGLPADQLRSTAMALVLFGAWLFWMTSQTRIPRRQAWLVGILDAVWVLGTVALLLLPGPLTPGGKWLLGAIGVVVLTFADLQFYSLWKTSDVVDPEVTPVRGRARS